MNRFFFESVAEDGALNSFLTEFHDEVNEQYLPDEEVVRNFANYPPDGYKIGAHRDTVAAGRKFLAMENPNWESVQTITNRSYHNDLQKMREWLESMLNLLEQELDKKDAEIRNNQSSL